MNKSSRSSFQFQETVTQYFGSGWAFFLPYLCLYLLFWACDWRVSTLTTIFYCLHGLHAIGLAYFIRARARDVNWRAALFWLALTSLFFNVGAYLEFPSDPWQHLWRIFQWQQLEIITEAQANHKFSYFLGHSLIGWTQPENHKTAIDLYFVFWGLLLALQFHRLAKNCSLIEPWAKLAVFGTVLMMGNSSFGFYRYYGISSTMLGTTAYLAGLNATIEYSRSKKSILWIPIGCSLILSFCNHPQSILLYLASATGVAGFALFQKFGWKTFFFKIVSALLITGILFHLLLEVPWLANFKATCYPIWSSGTWLYEWGGFKIFSTDPQINNASGRFLQIIGGLGIVNLIIAILLAQKQKLAGWITLSPMLLLLYPPFAISFLYLIEAWNNNIVTFHRVLLAIPQGFCLFIFMQHLCQRFGVAQVFAARNATPILAIVLIISSLNARSQYFGRFQQTFLQTPEPHSFGFLTETTQWLKDNIDLGKNQYLLSDRATQYAVSTHLGTNFRWHRGRILPENLKVRIDLLGGVESILQKTEIKGVLTLARQPEVDPAGSLLGKASKHWYPHTFGENLLFFPSMEQELQPLIDNEWKKFSVPPWYTLYARPKEIP